MAVNEILADRVRTIISQTHEDVEEKRMFGALCFMVDGKMCVGVQEENIMVRVNAGMQDELLEKDGCRQMDMGGKVMKSFFFVDESVLGTQKKLNYWVQLALDYNKIARPSKKRK
ncbi:MAG: TfoX/Sxy family protein [Bacteroidota bacterium]|nr:TfoX/Sxy family protein [Ferruginibacter sp.]